MADGRAQVAGRMPALAMRRKGLDLTNDRRLHRQAARGLPDAARGRLLRHQLRTRLGSADPSTLRRARSEVRCHQIKEKFGGLRFYVSNACPDAEEAIAWAEKESFKVCEHCGAPGKPRRSGWIKAECDSCTERNK